MKSRIGQQPFDLKQTRQMKAKNNDDHSCNTSEQRFVLCQNLPDLGRDRTQRDKDNTKADDERRRIQHHLAKEFTLFHLQLLDAHSRDQRNITWNEWKNARRQKRNKSCNKSGKR